MTQSRHQARSSPPDGAAPPAAPTGRQWQLRFDGGRQQRYFPDRGALLRFVQQVSRQSPHPRYEVWAEGEPVRLADGRDGGKRFEFVEALDIRDEDTQRRLAGEPPGQEPID
ncbi:MAG: hypothetical protein GEU81_03335 [Nitriliruptorales bacterium]|nr:hypothetical protein [Nitriliruptorales bacterium]